jgi:uncharacterized protein (UPF0147 family)
LFTGIGAASAQDYFRVIGGIPHLPAVDPSTISAGLPGMMIYSLSDKQPVIYNGSSWETLCSSNINTHVVKDYLEVKTGIPYLSSLVTAPVGDVLGGGIFYSKSEKTIMVHDGSRWTPVAQLNAKASFKTNDNFSTHSELKISRLPVLPANPIPLGLSAGAIYINSVSNAIRYYDGIKWIELSCLPVITTILTNQINNTSARSGVDIQANGGSAVTLQGICWSTSRNPDTSLTTKTKNLVFGKDTGIFPGVLSGLQASTVYHVRAYAVNSSGIVYGEDLIFKTAIAAIPSIITIDISHFTPISANSGGIINDDGGAPITARGIIWSATGDPMTDPAAVISSDGSGVGSFPSKLTDLLRNTKYYVRAYAVNVGGTGYGNLLEFTTPSATAPVLSSPNIRITDITEVSALSEVTIINNGGEVVTERGMSWSTDRVSITYGPSSTVNPTDIGKFICNITGLIPGTLYYVRAYAKNSIGTSFSSESSFITTSLPTLSTVKPFNYDAASHENGYFEGYNGTIAYSGADITSNGVSPVTTKGICWTTSATEQPTTALTTKTVHPVIGSGTGLFYSYLTSLNPGTTYYVRAYAINSLGTSYGETYHFTTPEKPSLTTTPGTLISSATVSAGGNISADGRMPVHTRGICWSRNNNPSLDGDFTTNGNGSGNFISNIKGLMGNTTYFISAYATNNVGTSYGEVLEFETAPPVKPVVTTSKISATAGASTIGGGDVKENGGAAVTLKGLLWSLVPNFIPDLNSADKTELAGGDGQFNSTITGLAPNKIYYVRAYAINSAGVSFGAEESFHSYTIPSLITSPVSNVTSTNGVGGGDIFNDGGDPVRTSGIVWNTSVNPTTDLGTKTISGTGIGNFIHNLNELMGNTTYYVRAYASNSAGTAYGNEVSFKTGPAVPPTISTLEATQVSGNSAMSGGRLVSNGGALITSNGMVWNTLSGFQPDTETKNRTLQNDPKSFTTEITGLTPGTIYYARAYAGNPAGLVYGNEVVFKTATLATITTLKPIAASITSTSATSGGSILNNGGSYIRNNGICWSTRENPTMEDEKVIAGSGTGSFTAELTDLLGSTTYYVRAFASNFAGVAYGNQEVLFTKPAVAATVITTRLNGITGKSAEAGGNITSNGGGLVTTRGVLWSIYPDFNPDTVVNNKTAETGYVKGVFTSQIRKLSPGTTYYVRAYAVTAAGIAYGEVVNFTTPRMPEVNTNPPKLVGNTSVVMGGTVLSSEGSNVTARGVFWSSRENFIPDTLSADRTYNGGGLGSFDSKLQDLKPDTKYFVRAYAVSIAGISYGEQVSFTTFPPTVPVLTTVKAIAISGTGAVSGGNIEDEGGVVADTRGVVWSTQPNFDPLTTGSRKTTHTGSGKGVFNSNITGLNLGTTYYIRAYAANRVGTGYGDELSFTTHRLPSLSTIDISVNAANKAKSGGTISFDGGTPIIAQGVCWSLNPNPTIGLTTKTIDAGTGVFTSLMSNLKPVTTYYVRAYAINSIGVAYGDEISFVTAPVLPVLTTTDPVITSNTTVSSGGTISFDGGAAVTARGIVWSEDKNFKPETVLTNRTTDGQGIGGFISGMSGLVKSISYYVRAYATNSVGTAYGDQFHVSIFATSPLLNTNVVSAITGTTATSGGEITSDGGAAVFKRGICWGTEQNPTIALPGKTSNEDLGNGTFVGQMIGLLPNTLYYVRAYAINGIGVAYGLEESFLTLAVPTLTATTPVTNIRATTATSGGTITDDGRTPILSRGIVWSLYSNPTTALSTKTTDNISQGTGTFTAELTGLEPNKTYYVRAYAVNSVGTNYGSETTLKTNTVMLPSLSTNAITDADGLSAKSGGNISDDGGMPVTARGLVWNTIPVPTVALPTKIVHGNGGTGLFEDYFSGLIPGTTYYVRAYATNSLGTAYGNEITFVTPAVVPRLSNVVISNINRNNADATASLLIDGGAAVTDLGLIWNTVDVIPTPLTADNSLSVGALGTSVSGTLTRLLPATKYYVWAYGTNPVGTGYSSKSVAFSTPDLATVITTKPSLIAQSTARSGGQISTDGGNPITAKGVCWSTTESPVIGIGNFTTDGTGNAAFASSMTALQKGTVYYVRAYATNGMGTAYGNQESFTTLDVPALSTNSATEITSTSGLSGGEITADGGADVTVKGVVWDTKELPTIALTTKTSIAGKLPNPFTGKMSPLAIATKYYFRAYATNSVGTAYGDQQVMNTSAVLPVVTIAKLSNMTTSSAVSTAEVTSDGGAMVTARGFIWNTTGNPTIGDGQLITEGTGMGIFNHTISGLTEGPVYYIRAYATNGVGTVYSAVVTTFKICPSTFTINHYAGYNGAAVTKTVTYNVVSSNVSGEARCWITQNLGADQPATAWNDATEASAGWYWQFNRLQGYKLEGAVRTPGTTWNTVITENENWSAENDPCNQLLGGGWRIPTSTEWAKAAGAPQSWGSPTGAYASDLKLHSAGNLTGSGALTARGSGHGYWTATTHGSNSGWGWYLFNGGSVQYAAKYTAYPVRCLSKEEVKRAPSVGNVSVPPAATNATSTEASAFVTLDGGAPVTARGFVWNTTGNPTLADQVLNAGSGLGDFNGVLTGLSEGLTYYIRAFATNTEGTNYSAIAYSFRVCIPLTVAHKAGVKGSAVDKTVTYQTASANFSGAMKCWITQNLGADQQATAVNDATEASAGWNWQFNRLQGFKHDGVTRTPTTGWQADVYENSDWLPANDPCTQLLGTGWRIPTATEWRKAIAAPQSWTGPADIYNSVLKMHAAGHYTNATLNGRGSSHGYWTSSQNPNISWGWYLFNGSSVAYAGKVSAYSIRCLKD